MREKRDLYPKDENELFEAVMTGRKGDMIHFVHPKDKKIFGDPRG